METVLRSRKHILVINIDKPLVIIGEKINPTGRKKMIEALQTNNLDYVRALAETQVIDSFKAWLIFRVSGSDG